MRFEDNQAVTINFPGQIRRGRIYPACQFTARVHGRDNSGERIRIVADEDAERGSYTYVPVDWIIVR